MANNEKRTLNQAKADMDSRVHVLRGTVARGEQAAERLPLVVAQLDATRNYLRTSSVYETARYEDGEMTLDDLEHEVDLLNDDIRCADEAKAELAKAASFYRAYHYVVNGPKIRALKRQITDVEGWIEQWKTHIAILDTETDDVDVAEHDRAYLEYECECAREKLCRLQKEITDLRLVRYM